MSRQTCLVFQGGGPGNDGIVQMAARDLFDESLALQQQRRQQGQRLSVTFEASMLEIYNEKAMR